MTPADRGEPQAEVVQGVVPPMVVPPASSIEDLTGPSNLVVVPPRVVAHRLTRDGSDSHCLGSLQEWQDAWPKETWVCRVVSSGLSRSWICHPPLWYPLAFPGISEALGMR